MTDDPQQLSEFLGFAHRLADAAAAVTLPLYRQALQITNKAPEGRFDPVTEADRGAEETIRRLIKDVYPSHGILGEEYGHDPGTSPLTWVIDPIDGTRSFVAGIPLWTTLIALNDGDKPILGVIDQPYLGERFTGGPNGATLKTGDTSRKLATRSDIRLGDAIFSTTSPDLFEAAHRPILDAVTAQVRMTRYGCDCYAYALLAAGFVDLVIETGLHAWDVQAFIPIVRAAGGAVARFDGGPPQDGGNLVVAANEALLAEALDLVQKYI